jgi:hypothetical protein
MRTECKYYSTKSRKEMKLDAFHYNLNELDEFLGIRVQKNQLYPKELQKSESSKEEFKSILSKLVNGSALASKVDN